MSHELTLFPSNVSTPGQRQRWQQRIVVAFQDHLAEDALKLTPQRQAILEALFGATDHLDLDGVYGAVKRLRSGIGRATVFRTLKLLERYDLVDRVDGANGVARFELKHDRPHHDHMVCVECGAILEFHNDRMEAIQNEAIREAGFTALWHRHEIFGRCRGCAGKRASAK